MSSNSPPPPASTVPSLFSNYSVPAEKPTDFSFALAPGRVNSSSLPSAGSSGTTGMRNGESVVKVVGVDRSFSEVQTDSKMNPDSKKRKIQGVVMNSGREKIQVQNGSENRVQKSQDLSNFKFDAITAEVNGRRASQAQKQHSNQNRPLNSSTNQSQSNLGTKSTIPSNGSHHIHPAKAASTSTTNSNRNPQVNREASINNRADLVPIQSRRSLSNSATPPHQQLKTASNSRPINRNPPEEEFEDSSPEPKKIKKETGIGSYLDNLIHDKEDQIKRLKLDLSTSQESNRKIRSEVVGRVKKLTEKADIAKRAAEGLVTTLRTDYQTLRSELTEMSKSKSIRLEVDELKQMLNPAWIIGMEDVVSRSERQQNDLGSEREKQREVIDQLRVQLELKTGEIIEARDRVSTLEASTVNLVRAAGDRRLEQEWSEKITETTERFFALDKRVTESSDKTLLLTAELEEKNLELIRLQSQMDGLKEEIQTSDERSRNSKAASVELQGLNESLTLKARELDGTILELTSEVSRTGVQVARFELDVSRLENAIKSQTELHLSTSRLLLDAQAKAQQLEDESSLLKVAITARECTLVRVADQVNFSKKEKSDLEARNSMINEQLISIEQSLRDKEVENKDLKESFATLEAVYNSLRTDLDTATVESAQLVSKLSNSTKDNSMLSLQIKNEKEKNIESSALAEKLEADNKKLREEKVSLSAEIQDRNERLQAAQTTQSTLEQTIQDLNSRLSLSESSLVGSQAKLERKVDSMEIENKKLLAQIETIAASTRKATLLELKDMYLVEKSELNNQVKRANNRATEKEKQLNKALTELAVAKNKPIIDADIVNTSPTETSVDDRRDTSVVSVLKKTTLKVSKSTSSSTAGTLTEIEGASDNSSEISEVVEVTSHDESLGQGSSNHGVNTRRRASVGKSSSVKEKLINPTASESIEEIEEPTPAPIKQNKPKKVYTSKK